MKKIRKIKNCEIAEITMISKVHISNVLSGKQKASLKTAIQLSEACRDLGAFIPHYMFRGGYAAELKARLGR